MMRATFSLGPNTWDFPYILFNGFWTEFHHGGGHLPTAALRHRGGTCSPVPTPSAWGQGSPLRPQTALTSDAETTSRLSPVSGPAGCKSGLPTSPSGAPSWLMYKWLPGLRKPGQSLNCWFITKNIKG